MRGFALAAVFIGAAVIPQAAGQEYQLGSITVADPFARASATPAALAGVVYLTLTNLGELVDRLVAVTTTAAANAHVHATTMQDGVMRMLPVDALELPGGAATSLAPGGLHIMLTGLHAPLIAGETFDLTLTFGQAGTIVIKVPVGDVAAMSRR